MSIQSVESRLPGLADATLAQTNGSQFQPLKHSARRAADVDLENAETSAAAVRHVTLSFCVKYLTQTLVTSLPLIVSDVLALAIACFVSMAVFSAGGGIAAAVSGLVFVRWTLVLMQPMIGATLGLYPAVGISPLAEFRLTTMATTLWIAILDLICFSHAHYPVRMTLTLTLTWLLALLILPVFRCFTRSLASRFSWWAQPVIIFGSGPEALSIYRRLLDNPSRALRPVGVIGDLHTHWNDPKVDSALLFLGPPSETRRIVDTHSVFWGIVAQDKDSGADLSEILDGHAATVPHLLVVDGMDDGGVRHWCGARDCDGIASYRIDERLLLPGCQAVKRSLDLLMTVAGALTILPIIVCIACAVKLGSPGTVFYSQERVGFRGQKFRMWKFRSMVVNADQVLAEHLARDPEARAEWARLSKLKHDPRVTRIGALLRKTSLDELPQIWNVIRGDMSLVGPRPVLTNDIGKHGSAYELYKRVLPGMTGLWQVSGRSNTTYKERVQLDAGYVRNWSPVLDLYILARTLKVVLRCEGAY